MSHTLEEKCLALRAQLANLIEAIEINDDIDDDGARTVDSEILNEKRRAASLLVTLDAEARTEGA